MFALVMSIFVACGTSGKTDMSNQKDEPVVELNDVEEVMTDGFIQETDVFEIESKLKSTEGYNWSEDHGVVEGKNGWFGTCLCEDANIWCDLYAVESKEVTNASLEVCDEDFELLSTFASFFETSHVNADEVRQWIESYNFEDEYAEQVFGDAEFLLLFDSEEGTISLSITGLE